MRKIITNKISNDIEPVRHLLSELGRNVQHIDARGLAGAARSFLTAMLYQRIDKSLLVICPEEKEAMSFAQDLRFFLGEEEILYYPPLDYLAIDMFALQKEEALARLNILASLQIMPRAIIVAPAIALMQKVMPLADFNNYLQIISIGDTLLRDEFCRKLVDGGYRNVGLVEEKGDFSVRGSIIDVFPPQENNPLRLEMMGDEIETIRKFDPVTQRSISSVQAFLVSPANEVIMNQQALDLALRNIRRRADDLSLPREIRSRLAETLKNNLANSINPIFLPLFYETYDEKGSFSQNRLASFFDYLPSQIIAVMDDELALQSTLQNWENNVDKLLFKAKNSAKFYLDRESIYLTLADWQACLSNRQRVNLTKLKLDNLAAGKTGESFFLTSGINQEKTAPEAIREDALLKQTLDKIKTWLAEGMTVIFFSPTAEDTERLKHLLLPYDLPLEVADTAESVLAWLSRGQQRSSLILRQGKISAGFVFPAMKLVILSEEEIFGKKTLLRRVRPAREGYFLKSFGDLKENDYVVHTDFGIGFYRGLQKIKVGEIENDFLVIEYLDGDKLYLPVNSLEKIQRYLGPEGFVPKIDKMGGTSWETLKERVRKSVREVAEELVTIYAAREVMEREPFSPPDRIYEEFCSTFEFEETPDQAKAIEDIHLDMNEAKPMDRLICGDAGFGKTEVAIRAAMRAVMDGKQVAVLVPTTILAEQHYATFSRRLKDFPVHVEVLNRFKSSSEQKKIVTALRTQNIDILIGTHRILQKDIEFKNLGLVVVDEEQRFGVAHKEKLKKMRTLVDVITLSATPIPRTLHLSLVGIRDLSIINTPPEERQPIKTYVLEFDEDAIKAAIEKELARQGQVFFVHDRVRSIYSIARMLERLTPQAAIEIVHGQMKPAEIEKAMARFVRQECNVLVCTTIIGSGLDIPTANTIIINRADRFGLAQLYQIRGRVGRSNQEAFAYLLLPQGALLSREAMKRLQVIREFSEAGSGFRISYNDLEMRGGGNMLGISQSGHVSAVGYELYTQLMERTIGEIQGKKKEEEELVPEIQLGISAFLPEEYVPDVHQRLVLYKRISIAENDEEIDQIKSELNDCYGALPPSAENLLRVIVIRNHLRPLKIKKMGYDGRNIIVNFQRHSPVNPAKIIEFYRKKASGLRFTPDYKLILPLPDLEAAKLFEQIDFLLKKLAESS